MAWEGMFELVGGSAGVRVAAGLHPELVASRYREVELLCGLVSETEFVGEIGLDGSGPHRSSLAVQRVVFDTVLSTCEARGGRVMTVHSRGAASLVLDHLEAFPRAGTAVLHWFSGSTAELNRAIEMGCWFSVGPAMLRSRSGRKLASRMPRERVLTETDGPLARKERGGPLFPWDVEEAEVSLGDVWRIPVEAVRGRLLMNFRGLLAGL